jgi:hypothetical protein
MNVGELRKILKNYNNDTPVVLEGENWVVPFKTILEYEAETWLYEGKYFTYPHYDKDGTNISKNKNLLVMLVFCSN